MNQESVLSEIYVNPEILEHIVDVSEVVKIRLQGVDNYSFTITLDDSKCINILRAIEYDNQEDAYQDMCDLIGLLREAANYSLH